VDAARVNRVFSEPRHAVEREAQRVDLLSSRMEGALTARLAALHRRFDAAAAALTSQRGAQLPAIRARVAELESRLRQAVLLAKERTARRVATEAARLQALNPLAVLDRGYSLTRLGDGTLLTSPAQATPGLRLVTRLAKGEVASVVEGAAASVPPPAVSGAVPAKPPARRRAPRASEADLFLPGFDGDARGTP
jgi:exodeoxyribonuclease VII large subunit